MSKPTFRQLRTGVLAVLLLAATPFLFGQSLGEVAKRERERREKNKQAGREAIVITENEIWPEEERSEDELEGESAPAPGSRPSPAASVSDEVNYEEEYDEEMEGSVPDFIPPSLPMDQKLQMFELMKRHYLSQVRELDDAIAENEAQLRELENEIAQTSAMGGAGLPVAPRTGTASTKPLTGQESATLVAEQQQLERVTEGLRRRKEELRLTLQEKGRVAGIPAGYLRF